MCSSHFEVLDFSQLSHDEIESLLKSYQIRLSVDEALTIQHTLLKRPPTLAECLLWSIQGSEHCSYKSSRKHLRQFVTKGPHVILGPSEDAGIVSVAVDQEGKRYGIVMSHESHNHPSQIVPYEGAATGVGGNVRDVSCMGAEVIAIADGLRFGDLKQSKTHWVHHGVVSGIAGYGNPLGVPNLAGDVYYDAAYNENCLVTVVTLGVIREDHLIHSYVPSKVGEAVYILVGKPTDNSGFGGASFASSNLNEAEKEKNKGAVQEPNAFLQRHLLKANQTLFSLLQEQNLLSQVGFKDLGAGGIACASVEMAQAAGLGAEIDLDCVPVSRTDLPPAVILCAETQERFMWVVPSSLADMILTHYNETFALPEVSAQARAAIVGKVRLDEQYVVTYQGGELVSARAADITQGILYDREWVSPSSTAIEPLLAPPADLNAILLALLRHENVASRAPIYEMYDKQVQGRTIIEAGWADAGVMAPFNEEKYPEEIRATGIALSLDHNPRYNKIDAYWGAVNAVCESVRNVTAVGATPLAITDCLCFGNPERKEEMGKLVASIRGIADACKAVTLKAYPSETLPVIAGNVSLYNESAQGTIPPSPMVSCLGSMPDVSKAITYDLKKGDTYLILVGERLDELGGSLYYETHHVLGAQLPKPDLASFARQIHAVCDAIQQGCVVAAHDISDGGIAVALCEMSFKQEIGMSVTIPGTLSIEKQLFSETGGFVLQVPRDKFNALKSLFARYQVEPLMLGRTIENGRLQMNGVIDLSIRQAKDAWLNGLREKLI